GVPLPVEAVAPRVSQPPCPDLLGPAAGGEGIGWRDGVGQGAVDINAQHLAKQGVLVLPIAERIPSPTSVARGDVQVAIGSEADPAAIVVGVGLMVDLQDDPLGAGRCTGPRCVGGVL